MPRLLIFDKSLLPKSARPRWWPSCLRWRAFMQYIYSNIHPCIIYFDSLHYVSSSCIYCSSLIYYVIACGKLSQHSANRNMLAWLISWWNPWRHFLWALVTWICGINIGLITALAGYALIDAKCDARRREAPHVSCAACHLCSKRIPHRGI